MYSEEICKTDRGPEHTKAVLIPDRKIKTDGWKVANKQDRKENCVHVILSMHFTESRTKVFFQIFQLPFIIICMTEDSYFDFWVQSNTEKLNWIIELHHSQKKTLVLWNEFWEVLSSARYWEK